MRHERYEPRGLARILVDRLARTSIHRDPPGFPDPHGMPTVVDPQVPEGDRELLRYTDPARLADARAHTLRQLCRSRWHAPTLALAGEQARERAAQALSRAATWAALGTVLPILMGALPVLIIGEMPPLAALALLAVCGWGTAGLAWWDFVRRTGIRRRPRVDPAHAAAHRHPGRFVLPEDLGEEGRALVAHADRMVDNAAVHERIPDQEPVLNEHVWRLAENAAAHERARQQGANAQALDESLDSLIEHADRLSARVHQALSNAPAGGQEAAGAEEDPAAVKATQDLRARQAGTQIFLNELRDEAQQAQHEHGSDPWERVEGAERLKRMDTSNPDLAAEIRRGQERRRACDDGADRPAHENAGATGPLHAHEVTPADAAFMRMTAGAHFGGDVTLPSGKTVTGAEMNRWVREQG